MAPEGASPTAQDNTVARVVLGYFCPNEMTQFLYGTSIASTSNGAVWVEEISGAVGAEEISSRRLVPHRRQTDEATPFWVPQLGHIVTMGNIRHPPYQIAGVRRNALTTCMFTRRLFSLSNHLQQAAYERSFVPVITEVVLQTPASRYRSRCN